MGRRRKRGQPVHGWVVLDKPLGMSSTQATGKVRWLLDAQRAGHGGTLDPLATGVLPIALGEATKTVSWVLDGAKAYRFTLRFGEERTTDDAEGTISAVSDVRPENAAIEAALGGFLGEIEQIPPAFSAIHVDGKRAYELARADKPVEMAPRTVQIDDFVLVDRPDPDHAVFEVSCGKGTYIRALARDLARVLGSAGHVAELRRTRCGPFTENGVISLDSLTSLVHSAPPSEYLLAVETALDDIPALALNAAQADHLRHGRPVRVRGAEGRRTVETGSLDDGAVLCAMAEGRAVALARLDGDEIRPVRVLNL
jgi:tRNA pseudouridine55 synthase